MPVALIMAADGVCYPTSAALIIGRQRRQGDVVFTKTGTSVFKTYSKHTVFRESPKISDKSYTSSKEIQLHRQAKENWTYYFANKKSQR